MSSMSPQADASKPTAAPAAAPASAAPKGPAAASARAQTPGLAARPIGAASPPARPGSPEAVRNDLRSKNYGEGVEYVKPGGELSMSGAEAKKQADEGLEGPGGELPYLAQIQKSFGGHSLSGVKAYVGGAAAESAQKLGVPAYTKGDKIVFRDKPDLHMAAHEAAHVVQQRQGRLPAGGKGAPGDAFEREADQVADQVVAGKPAGALMGPKKEGATYAAGDAVQAYAGNVDTATTSGSGTVREQTERNFGKGPAGERDSNFNPALKVEFEGRLGRALLQAQGFYQPVIANVSYGIYRYLQAKAEVLQQSEKQVMEQAFESFSFMYDAFEPGKQAGGVFYGRIRDDMADKGQYFQQMTDLLLGGAGTVQNHMLAHQCFLDKVLDAAGDAKAVNGAQPAAQFLERMRATAAQRKDEKDKQLAGSQAPDLKHLRKPQAGQADPFGETGKGVNGMEARGRLDMRKGFNPKKGGVDPSGPLPPGVRFDERLRSPSQVDHSLGIAAEEDASTAAPTAEDRSLGLDQKHSRGIETYTLDESQTFVQQARTQLNMPLAAGISGTTTDLHEVAKMFGVASPVDQFKYQLACLAHLGSAGAHSFHEIMAAAALNTGVQYEPGNYRSILKYGVEGVPEVKALFDDPKYADIPGIGDPAKLGGKTSENTAGPSTAAVTPPPPPAPNPAAAPKPAKVA